MSAFRCSPVARPVAAGVILLAALAVLVSPATSAAQPVGNTPDRTPYGDVALGQTLTLSGGWLNVGRDPAGAAQKAGGLVQLRYDAAVGGPVILYARYAFAPSERRELDPTATGLARQKAMLRVFTNIATVGMELALTGQKSWHHLVPTISGGVGVALDPEKADTSGYQFGSKFVLSYGAGVRYLAPRGIRVHLEATNFAWQYSYPQSFLTKASDGTAILANTKDCTRWRGSWGLMAGLSYPIFR